MLDAMLNAQWRRRARTTLRGARPKKCEMPGNVKCKIKAGYLALTGETRRDSNRKQLCGSCGSARVGNAAVRGFLVASSKESFVAGFLRGRLSRVVTGRIFVKTRGAKCKFRGLASRRTTGCNGDRNEP